MDIASVPANYNLSREAASRLLKVSIRTLDRYLKSKKLSSSLIDGRIWLNKAEIEGFKLSRRGDRDVDKLPVSTSEMSTDFYVGNADNIEVLSQDNVDFMSTKTSPKAEKFNYKNLYEELKGDLREKQERLEIANYRVGQLEAQIKNSIPLLEYHRENYYRKQEEGKLNQKIKESEEIIQKLHQKTRHLKISKKIYIIILLIILALQPLWLLLVNFNNFF